MPSFSNVYAAVGCSKASSVADSRTKDGLVVYGGGSLLCFWQSDDVTNKGIHLCLRGHEAHITAVKFERQERAEDKQKIIATGDAAGHLKLWAEYEGDAVDWQCVATQKAHEGSLAALSCTRDAETGDVLAVTGGSDCQMKVWLLNPNNELTLAQTLDTKGKLPMDMALSRLPESLDIVLAAGTTDLKVHLFTRDPHKQFRKRASLGGHTDWIRCLAFSPPISDSSGTNHLLLASGAQDGYVRLWRVKRLQEELKDDLQLDELDLETRTHPFPARSEENTFAASSESVLLGHEGWVTNVHWTNPSTLTTPKLLSCSADRSVIIWTCAQDNSYWTNETRLGEIGGSAGLGFFGALPGKDSRSVIAHDFSGSLLIWHQSGTSNIYTSGIGIGGHHKDVTALQWQPTGEWLMSASLDQTTRLHAPWKRKLDGKLIATWHEIARPQIHGHDIYALANLDPKYGLKFASGSDEMVIRLFKAPRNFVDSIAAIAICEMADSTERPGAAVVPALGLSNRVASNTSKGNSRDDETLSKPRELTKTSPPVEEDLVTSTLWPETDKLYGHGFELRNLAVSHGGRLLASTSRASTPEYAAIHLRTTSDMKAVGDPLIGHTLSVTKIAFSPDDRHILCVGRDRSWHIFTRGDAPDFHFNAEKTSMPKAHSRIIFDCCWLGSSEAFATAGRDKAVKIWVDTNLKSDWKCVQSISMPSACTAVAFSAQGSILAVGQENGDISLFRHDRQSKNAVEALCEFPEQ